ncbi:MAG TPA: hypothetical protein VFG15_06130 [Amycolatopsis sp.]|nr:hypothetical protein [Amycolatopsis sp.]
MTDPHAYHRRQQVTDIPPEATPTNELARGLRNGGTTWSAYVNDMEARGRIVDLHQPATDRARRRWANSFTTPLTPPEMDLGEDPPAPIPARPYTGEPLDFVRLGQQLDDADFTAAHDSVRPELAAALQAADDENSTGATVLSLDDIATSGMVAFRRFLDAEIAKAATSIPPGYDISVSCDSVGNVFDSNRVAFKITGTPRAQERRSLGMDPLAHLRRQLDIVEMGITQPIPEPEPVKPRAHVVPFGPSFTGVGITPEHQHIWTSTSPMRCVDCRRYLRPWWRRALDRARWWTR